MTRIKDDRHYAEIVLREVNKLLDMPRLKANLEAFLR